MLKKATICLLCIYCLFFSFRCLYQYIVLICYFLGGVSTLAEAIQNYTLTLIYSVCSCVVSAILLIKTIRSTNVTNAVRLTYEEFKERMQAKKAAREAEQKSKRMASLERELAALKAEQEESTE